MLQETLTLDSAPRPRRPTSQAPAPGTILFGLASPVLPALQNQWPSWLAPATDGWRSTQARSGATSRRSSSP